MMTDITPWNGGQPDGYSAGLVMTPDAARALDEQVRRCTEAVLREGTDYGIIPGTNGEKTLWRPGAQKLLQWFGLSFSCERVEIERDDDGRKHGITYRAIVARRLPDGSLDIKATCEGTADYDESKFYQSQEQVKARLRDQEHKWAAKDRRAPNADRWNSAREYRADWNALMKRAQKRAIVGAVVDATAAGGIFSDREEDDSHAPAAQDDGPAWFEQALENALTFTDVEAGRRLYLEAVQAHRDGSCTRRQADHIQNRIKQRVQLLQAAAPVDVEDLAQAAHDGADDPARRHRRLVGAVQGRMRALGFEISENTRPERMAVLNPLARTSGIESTSDFDDTELTAILGALAGCKDQAGLAEVLAVIADNGDTP
jgi:hypothetical protein